MLHNPNNWHWVNKDASSWTKQYLEDHIKDIKAEEDGVTAQLDKLISMDGDVDVNQRKGKVITIFDVKLVIEYSGMEQNLSSGKETLTDQAKPRMTTMSAAQLQSPRLHDRQQTIECVQKDLEGHANNQRTIQRVLLLVPADKFHHEKKRKMCASKEESVSTYGVLRCVPQSGIGSPYYVSIRNPFSRITSLSQNLSRQ